MKARHKPIYLFADSQLLFWRQNGAYFLESLKNQIQKDAPTAAYVGASNGDNPDFYAIFGAAMANIGIQNHRMISAHLPSADAQHLANADLILLAGGNVTRGWRAFAHNDMAQTIVRRYNEGALLIGISAGAVQLGLVGWSEDATGSDPLFPTFGLVPYIVSAHDEAANWAQLQQVVHAWHGRQPDCNVQGIGIPTGGGVSYHASPAMRCESIGESIGEPHDALQPIRRAPYYCAVPTLESVEN